ncbi:flagellar motor switch protein FliN [Persephonella sp.]
MADEEKNNEEKEEEIDQEKLAEEWAKMAEAGSEEPQDSETSEESEEVDQDKLAEEWAKMAEESAEQSEEVDQEALAKEWEQMAAETEEKTEPEAEQPMTVSSDFGKSIEPASIGLEQEKLDLLMDIPLEVSVEIGSTHLPLEEILKLNPNNIVELDKFINQPVDLKVNGKLIAKGELYTVEDHFGIKITSIITVQERMKLLSEGHE